MALPFFMQISNDNIQYTKLSDTTDSQVEADTDLGGYVVSPRRGLCSPRSNLLKSRIAGFDGFVQILLGVGQRKKPGFELGRRKIDSLFHHLDKEPRKSFRIAHLGSMIIPHRPPPEKEGEHP